MMATACIALFILICFICGYFSACMIVLSVVEWREWREVETRENQRRRRRQLMEKAPVVHVGEIDSLNGWKFYIRPHARCFSGTDPETGETYFLGYTEAELREIAQRPEEFEQPHLEWFVREE